MSNVRKESRIRSVPKDVKLMDLHMKRKVPQLYLSKKLREGQTGGLNDFNSILNKSLLSPSRHRYVATKLEQESMEKSGAMTPTSKKREKLAANNRGWSTSRNADALVGSGGALPIISVASSTNSVDY